MCLTNSDPPQNTEFVFYFSRSMSDNQKIVGFSLATRSICWTNLSANSMLSMLELFSFMCVGSMIEFALI